MDSVQFAPGREAQCLFLTLLMDAFLSALLPLCACLLARLPVAPFASVGCRPVSICLSPRLCLLITFLCACLSNCYSVQMSICLSLSLPACLLVIPSDCFFFFCLSVFLFSACLSVSGSIFASQLVFFACLSVTLLSTCPPIDLLPSVFPSFYLPFCPLVSLSLNVCLLYASLLVLLSICLSVCLSLFAYPPVYLSARLSPTVPASPTVCLPVELTARLFLRLSVTLSYCRSACFSSTSVHVCPTAFLSACLAVPLPDSLCARLSDTQH